ncbi:unnamed protein product (macronuclear) [Paramecium tetraurelia]|uniref:Uncharacterized protein n=1 Tax=Paramecium tetraurelia TaxID=5888 RepID=A0EAU4_PARTE|nr:uncharacterized protein GSPATT00025145001 [Paramecium tetraurelia]CAK92411.1 unnamed protein product [Paramecium tetraurelia]|eukprot:XP_001459808.1 hypothetical protein (macronuclear) [Paramecium tetraurelia strain d4-2]
MHAQENQIIQESIGTWTKMINVGKQNIIIFILIENWKNNEYKQKVDRVMFKNEKRKNERSSKDSDSDIEREREIDYASENISLYQANVILLEPIIIDKNYLEKDIVAVLGNLVIELTDFTLFEYNSRLPIESNCIVNQSYSTKLSEELGERINNKNFGIFLKFSCSTKNQNKLKKQIKIGNDVIKLLKEFINRQTISSSNNLIDQFIQQLKNIKSSK